MKVVTTANDIPNTSKDTVFVFDEADAFLKDLFCCPQEDEMMGGMVKLRWH